MRTIAILIVLLAGTCHAQIILDGPDEPIDAKEWTQIHVRGISDSDLPRAKVEVSPSEQVTLIPARTWGGKPFILFSSPIKGEYTIRVTLNAWVGDIVNSVVGVAALVEDTSGFLTTQESSRYATILKEYQSFGLSLSESYKPSYGSCIVIVGGVTPPPPEPGNLAWVIIVEESSNRTASQALIATSATLRKHAENNDYHLYIFDKDAPDNSSKATKWIARAKEHPLPWVMLVDKEGVVLHEGPLSESADALIKMIEEKAGIKSDGGSPVTVIENPKPVERIERSPAPVQYYQPAPTRRGWFWGIHRDRPISESSYRRAGNADTAA